MALSIASILSHFCSGMTSGRYVAVKVFLDDILAVGRLVLDESGEGVLEEDVESRDGWGKDI